MVALPTLALFLAAVLMLFLSPGPNMAFVLAHGAAHGRTGAAAAALGIAAADLVLTLLTATGATALLVAWAPAFDLLRGLGAAYLLWMAWRAVRGGERGAGPAAPAASSARAATPARIFRRAGLNCLLNPKALLFFMVFLPQFVDTTRGGVGLQIATLGVVLSLAGLVFHLLLGLCSARVGSLLQLHPRAARFQGWALAAVLAALALRLVLLERPAAR